MAPVDRVATNFAGYGRIETIVPWAGHRVKWARNTLYSTPSPNCVSGSFLAWVPPWGWVGAYPGVYLPGSRVPEATPRPSRSAPT